MKANLPTNYIKVLEEIKLTIKKSRFQAFKAINSQLVFTYLELGKILLKQTKAGWGDGIIDSISKDLRAEFYGVKGFSPRNLRRMKMVSLQLELQPEILPQLVAELPWGHTVLLFEKVKESKNRLFFIQKAKQNSWSRTTLQENIEFELHKKTPIQNNFAKTLDQEVLLNSDFDFQDEYNFSFLGLGKEHSEKQLENGLVNHITKTLGQFGKDFAFMGRQFRLDVSDKEYFVDLLFYHRKLRSLIAIELKTTEFKPEHSQQLNWYLHLLDKDIKYPEDNPSIGILICRSKDDIVVEYALELATNPVGIATYSYQALPEDIAKYLPSEQELKNIFKDTQN
jgi:predicted nuclease of restriction endonuclease-like (RecB) superfamily